MHNPNKPFFLQQGERDQQAPPAHNPVGDRPPTGATAYMRTDIVDAHTYGMSIPTTWEKSYLCPCRNRKTRQPQQDCNECHGRGVAFLPAKEVIITVQSQEKGIVNSDLGLIDSGTAIGTPERKYRMAFRDRITIPTAKISQSMIFNVTDRNIKNGFYMIFDVEEIELIVNKERNLIEGEDYTFNEQENKIYPKEHLKGDNISINILTKLRYLIADLLKEHRYAKNQADELVKLPQKLLLKREDIFVDKEHFDDAGGETDGEMVDAKRPPSEQLGGYFGSGR